MDIDECAERWPESRLGKYMQELRRSETSEMLVLDEDSLGISNDGKRQGLECRKCKTRNPLIWQRQLRSADEPMTVFFLCRNSTCGFRWREG
jgi:DNA-directed RNA polymerase III subunit RPC11